MVKHKFIKNKEVFHKLELETYETYAVLKCGTHNKSILEIGESRILIYENSCLISNPEREVIKYSKDD